MNFLSFPLTSSLSLSVCFSLSLHVHTLNFHHCTSQRQTNKSNDTKVLMRNKHEKYNKTTSFQEPRSSRPYTKNRKLFPNKAYKTTALPWRIYPLVGYPGIRSSVDNPFILLLRAIQDFNLVYLVVTYIYSSKLVDFLGCNLHLPNFYVKWSHHFQLEFCFFFSVWIDYIIFD